MAADEASALPDGRAIDERGGGQDDNGTGSPAYRKPAVIRWEKWLPSSRSMRRRSESFGLIAYEPTDRLTVSIRSSITLAQGVFIVAETLMGFVELQSKASL